jgi:hypothetical protein
MKGGNSTAVSRGRVDCGRVRYRVNGSNEEQQTNQTYGPSMLQITLDSSEAVPLVGTRGMCKEYIKIS